MTILEVRDLSKSFGALQAVNRLSFEVAEQEILSIIGPNGAGKTTVLNLLTGINEPDSGEILLEGESIVGLESHAIASRGVSRTFQTLRLFLNMSVIENVMAAAFPQTSSGLLSIIFRTSGWRTEEQSLRQQAEETLAFFGERLVGYRFEEPAYSLSYANRRRLEIARALVGKPTLMLLDEPAAGMNPKETEEVTSLIGDLRDQLGITIVVIEHDMKVVEGISDRVIALDYGRKIAEGTFDEVTTDPQVIEAYLGRKARQRE